MKRLAGFAMVIAAGVGALVYSEVRRPEAPVSARTIVYFIADTERELSRVPARATRMSEADEIRIGNELAASYERRLPRPTTESDLAMQRYVERVGRQVSAQTGRRLPYTFHYVPSVSLVNAFALPGGHVFIGQGLINLMDTEDELANVLAHEVEHVDLYHCAERVQVEVSMRKLHAGVLGELAQLPLEVFQAGYSKDQELEADREGARLAVRAGYSPEGAIRLFQALQRLRGLQDRPARTPQEEVAKVAAQALSGYFQSHPLESDRIAQMRSLIAREHWENISERPLETIARSAAPRREPADNAPPRILR